MAIQSVEIMLEAHFAQQLRSIFLSNEIVASQIGGTSAI